MKTIKKEICLEDVTSRIPSLLPYIDFDIFGDSVLHNGTNDGTLGILRKATDGAEGSYGHVMGSFTMRIYEFDKNTQNIRITVEEYEFVPSDIIDLLEEITLEEADEAQGLKQWQGKERLSDAEYRLINKNFNIADSPTLTYKLNALKSKYIPFDDIELYDNAIMYYPSSYVNREDENDIINRFDYNELSLYGRNCYKPIVYIYRDTENIPEDKALYQTASEYDNIDDFSCDKYDYVPFLYINEVMPPKRLTESGFYDNSDILPTLVLTSNKYKGWIDSGETETVDDETYNLYREVISVDFFRIKSRMSKVNYKVLLCSDENSENTIQLPLKNINNEDNVNDVPVIIGENTFRPLFFMTTRQDNGYLLGFEDDVLTYEFYGLSLKKQLIKPGETYSYRTMMNAYYKHNHDKVKDDYNKLIIGVREATIQEISVDANTPYKNIYDEQRFVNKNNKKEIISFVDYCNLEEEKQSFIKFIDNALGKYYIKDAVEEYNNTHSNDEIINETFYSLDIAENTLTYEEIIDNSFYDVEEIYTCLQYVKTEEDKENDGNYEPYLYLSDVNGGYITSQSFEDLEQYGSNSYEAIKYDLINDDEELEEYHNITKEQYYSLPFYGQVAYTINEYINSEIISVAAYNAIEDETEKAKYVPYLYVNNSNPEEIITTNTYENAYTRYGKQNLFSPYQYVKSGYLVISTNEYDNFYYDDTVNEWFVYSYVNITKSNDVITAEKYESLPKYGVMDYTAVEYENIDSDVEDVIYSEEYYNLEGDGKTNYEQYKFIPKEVENRVIISSKKYSKLGDTNTYKPYIYAPNDEFITIDEFEFNALPKYGIKYYTEYQYYVSINVSPDGEDPSYEEFFITAEEFDDDSYWSDDTNGHVGSKYQYSIYSYAPLIDGDEPGTKVFDTDYIVLFEDYDNIPYFGQLDYKKDEIDYDIVVNGHHYTRNQQNDKIYQNSAYYCWSAEHGDSQDYGATDVYTTTNQPRVGDFICIWQPVEPDSEIYEMYCENFQWPIEQVNNITELTNIDVYREIYINKKNGQIISEKEWDELATIDQEMNYEGSSTNNKCGTRLVPEVIYLSQVNGLLSQMRNMKKNHELYKDSRLPLENDVNCEYSKYLRMGGDDMVILLEWLRTKAEKEAEKYMPYAVLDNYITLPLPMCLTLQDSGYYTPAMNYKSRGMTIYKGEPFTFVDDDGVAETYVYVGGIKDEHGEELLEIDLDRSDDWTEEPNIKHIKDEVIDGYLGNGSNDFYRNYTNPFQFCEVNNGRINTEVTLSGIVESKLKSLRMRKTYTNYLDNPETPSSGEDWLFYYKIGSVYDVTSATTDTGELVPIPNSGIAGNNNLLVYGNILTDIRADNDECTITFTYYTNAHLKVKENIRTETRFMNEEDYEYYSDRGVIESSEATDGGYNVVIKVIDMTYELDKGNSIYGKHHGVKHVDTYHYERYGELYELAQNEENFNAYVNSEQRGFEKYPFIARSNNAATKIVNNYELSLPYIGSEFEYTYDIKENGFDVLFSNVYKEDLLNGTHYKPSIKNDAFVLRGTTAAFERHIRLGEVKTLEDFENYHNGSFFNIRSNF